MPERLPDANESYATIMGARSNSGGWLRVTHNDDGTQKDGSVGEAALTLADVATANASTSKHGFAPKYPNDATKYLDGTGGYSVPAGGTASQVAPTYTIYKSGSNFLAKASVQSGLANVAANADAAAVLTSCLDNINGSTTPRGTVVFAANTTFVWNTVVSFRRTYGGPFTRSGTTTSGSAVVTGLSTTTDLRLGMSISGAGIPANTLIRQVGPTAGQVTLTKNATASATVTLSFYNGPDDEQWLRILGSGGTVLQLGSATQFFTYTRVADYDGFCGIEIGNLDFDCNNVVGTATANHVIIGTLTGGVSQVYQRTDFRRHWIHDYTLYNVPTAAIGGVHRAGIWIQSSHANPAGYATPEAIRNYMTDMRVERFRQLGGNTGILIAGLLTVAYSDGAVCNIIGDRWYIADGYIDSLSRDQSALDPGSGFQLGGLMGGESMLVERVETHVIGDDNEINGFRNMTVRDCDFYDNGQISILPTNFTCVNGIDQTEQHTQMVLIDNVRSHATTGKATTSPSKPSYGFSLGAGVGCDMGTVIYRNCSHVHHVVQTDLLASLPFYITAGTNFAIKKLIIEDFKAVAWYDGSASADTYQHVFFFYNGPERVTIRDLDVTMKGDRHVAGGHVAFWQTLFLNSPGMRLDIDGVTFRDETTNSGVGWTLGVVLGGDASAGTNKISGTVRGIYHTPSPGDTAPTSVYAYTSGSVKKLLIEDIDLSDVAGAGPYDGDAGNAAAVQLRNIKKSTLALPEVSFTPGATTVAAQYKGGYGGLMTVTGGTVTVVSVSTDNSTYRQVAAATNCAFAIDNGMWVKLTYSVTPTCAVIPNR